MAENDKPDGVRMNRDSIVRHITQPLAGLMATHPHISGAYHEVVGRLECLMDSHADILRGMAEPPWTDREKAVIAELSVSQGLLLEADATEKQMRKDSDERAEAAEAQVAAMRADYDHLREIAEVLNQEVGLRDKAQHNYGDALLAERETVAALRAEVERLKPPSDDGEPITEAWLRSVGFGVSPDFEFLFVEAGVISGTLEFDPDIGWILFGKKMKLPPSTRGEVRRLLAALGIESKAIAETKGETK